MSAGSIIVDLLMRTGAFEADAGKAARIAKERAKAIDEAFSAMATAVSGASIAAAGAIAAMVTGVTMSAKEIINQSQVAGAGAQEFQRFAYAAKSVGIEHDKLSDIFKDFREKVGEYVQTGGGGMKDFFEQIAPKIGVTADQFRNLSGPQALQLYMDSLEKAGLSQEQMSFYLESMASDTTALIPLLQDGGARLDELGAAAERTGQIMSDQTLAAAAAFDQQMQQLKGVMSSVSIVIASSLLPSLNEIGRAMSDAANDASGVQTVGDSVATVFEAIVISGTYAAAVVHGVGTAIGGIAARIVALSSGDFAAFSFIGDQMKADAIKADKEFDEFQARVRGARAFAANFVGPPVDLMGTGGKPAKPWMPPNPVSAVAKKTEDPISDSAKAYASAMDAISKAQVSAQLSGLELSSTQQRLAELFLSPAFRDMPETWRETVVAEAELTLAMEDRARQTESYLALVRSLRTEEEIRVDTLKESLAIIDAMNSVDEAQKESVVGRAIAAATSGAPEFAGLAPEVGGAFGELQKIDEAEQRLNDWYAQQLELLEVFRQQRADLNASFDAEELRLKQEHEAQLMQIERARQMAQLSAASSVFGSLADITRQFAGEQSGIFKVMFAIQKAAAIAQSIVAIQQGIAMAAANPWPANLAAMASVAAATASIVTNIASVTMPNVGARADGGHVSAGMPYLVGERGRELFVPNTAGKVLPNSMLGGGKTTVNLIEDRRRAGQTEERNSNGQHEVDVFISDILGDGPRKKAIARAFGLTSRGY